MSQQATSVPMPTAQELTIARQERPRRFNLESLGPMTFLFLFVLYCNLLGLFPFLGSPTASLTVTGTLALFSFLLIHGAAVAKMGAIGYFKSYVPHLELPYKLNYFVVPMIVLISSVLSNREPTAESGNSGGGGAGLD